MGNRLNNPSNLASVMAADAKREGVHVLGAEAPAAEVATPKVARAKRKAKAKRKARAAR